MDFFDREIFGLAALILGFVSTGVYVVSILKGDTRPHFFTHFIWFIITAIAYAAQLSDGAGPGSWVMGFTALGCLITAMMALKWGEKQITRGDKIALALSLAAIIPWVLTKDALTSVILICLIEAFAFFPTFRKSWMKPHQENMTSYMIGSLKFLLSFIALDNLTLTTGLYAGFIIVMNTGFVVMCLIRRVQLKSA